MRLQETIDFTTLTWVKPELDETLKLARNALQTFVEEGEEPSQLRACATYLHQVQGTLRMVELYGAAMVGEEMEQLARALMDNKVKDRDPAFAVLMQGIVQLPDYLERLQSGHRDIPIVLLPLLNSLREARGEKGLAESVLFNPDLSRPLPATANGPVIPLDQQELRRRAETLRALFQGALLRWLKDDNSPGTIKDLTDVCEQLVPITSAEPARRLFWVAAGTLDALGRSAFPISKPLKQALAKIEREIKRLAEQGDAAFRSDPPIELTKQLLYFVAHEGTDEGRIGEIRRVFNLGVGPSEAELAHARGSLSGHNRALLETVSAAIKEDLLRVKDALDIHLRTPGATAGDLGAQVEALDRVADTLGMLGLGVQRRVVQEQRTAINDVIAGQRKNDEATLLDIAGALLYVEASLDDQVERLGQGDAGADAGAGAPGAALPLPGTESRKVLEILIKEAIANFAQARQCFVAFVETHWDHAQLADVPRLLEEVGGALRILDLSAPPEYLHAVRRFTDDQLIRRQRVPTGQQMDSLADALASLEYFLEAVRDRRPNRDQILDVARTSLESLGYWPVPPEEAPVPPVAKPAPEPKPVAAAPTPAPAPAPAAVELPKPAPAPAPAAAPVEAAKPAPAPVAAAAPAAAPVAAAPAAAAVASGLPVVPGFDGSSNEEIDEEIREVFLEEFEEEISNLEQLLPPWRAEPASAELLRPIRRVFHTLKGSGRLVGAKTLGEFSWKIESMLNRVLDGTRPASPAVVALLDKAYETLPALRGALQGQTTHADLEGIQDVADRLAAGEEVAYQAPTAVAAVAAAPEPVPAPVEAPVEVEEAVAAPEPVAAQAMPEMPAPVAAEPEPAAAAEGAVFAIDPVLFEILQPEVAGHLETVDAWLATCRAKGPQPVTDPLLRSIHTMNGAFAMTDVTAITDVTAPLEGFIKRSLAHGRTPSAEGIELVAETADAIRKIITALGQPRPVLPTFDELAARANALRDQLPDPLAPSVPAAEAEEAVPMPQAVVLETPDMSGIPDFGTVDRDAVTAKRPVVDVPVDEPAIFEGAPAFELEQAQPAVEAEPMPAVEVEEIAAPTTAEPAFESIDFTLEEIPAAEAPAAIEAGTSYEAAMDFTLEEIPAVESVGEVAAAEPALLPETEMLSFDDFVSEPVAAADGPAGFELAEHEPVEAEPSAPEIAEAIEPSAAMEEAPVEIAEEAAPEAPAAEDDALAAMIAAFAAEPVATPEPAVEFEAEVPAVASFEAMPTPEAMPESEPVAEESIGMSLEELEVMSAPEPVAESEAMPAEEATLPEEAAAPEPMPEPAAEPAMPEPMPEPEVAAAPAALEAEVEAEAEEASSTIDVQPALAAAAAVPAPEPAAPAARGGAVPLANDPADPEQALDTTDLDTDLLDIFLEESTDILDHSDGLLAKLRDHSHDKELVVGLQRDLHTLKGGARMAGIYAVGELGHTMESLLEAVAEGRRELDQVGVVLLERGFDRLHSMVGRVADRKALALPAGLIAQLDAVSKGQPLPEAEGAAEAAAPAAETPASTAAPAAAAPAAPVPAAPKPAPAPAKAAEPATSSTLKPLSAPMEGLHEDEELSSVRAPQEQVRIRADLLDRLVNYAGEVAIYRARLEQQLGAFRANLGELNQTTSRLREQLRRLEIETEAQIVARYQREDVENDERFDPLELDRFSTQQQLSRALAESANDLVNIQTTLDDLTRQYETLLLQQSRVSSDLQEGLMRTRMVPFDALVPRLRRVLRQAASDTGKQVQLKVDGASGEMDRNVLDRMTAPLEHMLRNSMAHGLELPEERRKLGKPEEGTVRIVVQREGSEVVLKILDDGKGLNKVAIRKKAIEKGLIAADVELSDDATYALILEGGFSTAETVTRLAGRGVGMDVVYSEIRQLGGTLQIKSEEGKGSEFIIRLPFTLAVTQAVFVKIGETSFAVPIASVQGVGRIARGELEKQLRSERPVFLYAGEEFAIHDLGVLIGHQSAKAQDSLQMPLLLARSGDLRAAITIDQVLGSREIVVKPVGPQVNSVPGIFGATIMGDGRVVVILDVAPLVRRHLALQAVASEPIVPVPVPAARRVPVVMVVDDSITMRKVTGRVLERHNMEVLTAKDGVDAVEKMAERVPDLVLLDIEMPRMDGYEVAQNMRSDPRLKDVPIVMITSRTGEKHRQRAMDIGVNRYLGKPYQEPELMRNVFEMLGMEPVNG
jgi:chemosensory pili system protein ChpA (sensor histidine kinase/response regulator)